MFAQNASHKQNAARWYYVNNMYISFKVPTDDLRRLNHVLKYIV